MSCEFSRDIEHSEKSHENRSWEELTTVSGTVLSTPGKLDLKMQLPEGEGNQSVDQTIPQNATSLDVSSSHDSHHWQRH